MAEGPGQVYLVTGGCGFLGKHLVRLLVEQENRVSEIRVFDRKVDTEMESLSTDAVRVTLVTGDITEMDSVREAARGVDLIIHNAALVDVWGKYHPSMIWDINYQGTWNVLEACKELGIQYVVYTSTMETVGPNINRDHFIRGNEETQYNIINDGPYADSKAQAEKLVLKANGTKLRDGRVLRTCALRPTGVYGENNGVMEQLLHVLLKYGRRRLRVAGKEIEHSRVYVGNVAWMHLQAARGLQLRPEVLGGEAYFCYDDSPSLSYEEFDMELMGPVGIRMLGQTPPLPYFVLYLLASCLEALQWLLWPLVATTSSLNRYTLAMVTTPFTVQTDKATRHFGYQPLVSWQQSKARTVAWIKEVDRAYSQKK